MPAATPAATVEESRLVGVTMSSLPGVVYGFRTNIASTSSTKLGHVSILNASGDYIRGVLLGINSPKPPRAKKFFGTGTKANESSFIDKGAIDTARADGWTIAPAARPKRRKSSAFSKAVYVEFKVADPTDAQATDGVTIKYAWSMRMATYNAIAADRAALGIQDVTGDDVVVVGSKFKPPSVSKTTVTNGKRTTVRTFCASNKLDSLPDGWS